MAALDPDLADGDLNSQQPGHGQRYFHKLQQALLNEKIAPEILEYQADLVQEVTAALTQQDEHIDAIEADPDTEVDQLEVEVLSLERDRLRYLLKSYLRTRLHKIQEYAALVLADDDVAGRVSDQEQAFATSVFTAAGTHFKAAALDAMPLNYQSMTKRFEGDAHHSLVMRPDTQVMVFAQALADVGQVAQGREGDTALVSKGDQLVVQYSSIAPYVASGQMCLK